MWSVRSKDRVDASAGASCLGWLWSGSAVGGPCGSLRVFECRFGGLFRDGAVGWVRACGLLRPTWGAGWLGVARMVMVACGLYSVLDEGLMLGVCLGRLEVDEPIRERYQRLV